MNGNQGNCECDAEAFEYALRPNPNLSLAYSDLANIYYHMGRYRDAVETLNR